jgi:hypothetical protein
MRLPAGDGAARKCDVKALVGSVRSIEECDRERGVVSGAVSSLQLARADPRESDGALRHGYRLGPAVLPRAGQIMPRSNGEEGYAGWKS